MLIIQRSCGLMCEPCSAVQRQPWRTLGSAWTSARSALASTPPSSSPAYQKLPACSSRWLGWGVGQSACLLCSWVEPPASCRYCCPDTTVRRHSGDTKLSLNQANELTSTLLRDSLWSFWKLLHCIWGCNFVWSTPQNPNTVTAENTQDWKIQITVISGTEYLLFVQVSQFWWWVWLCWENSASWPPPSSLHCTASSCSPLWSGTQSHSHSSKLLYSSCNQCHYDPDSGACPWSTCVSASAVWSTLSSPPTPTERSHWPPWLCTAAGRS